MARLVFVYGTLRRGERNHYLLAGTRFVGEASSAPRFRLVDMGDYPAMVEGGTTSIIGELYEVSSEVLVLLDELEKHPDFYRRMPLRLRDGRTAAAYILPEHHARGRPVLLGGDWSGGC